MNTKTLIQPSGDNVNLFLSRELCERLPRADSSQPRSDGKIASDLRAAEWEALAVKAEYRPEQMAALRHITLRHLERLFHQQLDKTPTTWIREFRCRRVLEMLADGYSNKWIAFELRFSNPSHLCHEFKRVYGTSPRSFVRSRDDHEKR